MVVLAHRFETRQSSDVGEEGLDCRANGFGMRKLLRSVSLK